MLHAFLTFAAETAGEETSKTPFYVAGTVLAVWAVVVSAIGISRHADWPASKGPRNVIMGISTVLVVLAMAGAVVSG